MTVEDDVEPRPAELLVPIEVVAAGLAVAVAEALLKDGIPPKFPVKVLVGVPPSPPSVPVVFVVPRPPKAPRPVVVFVVVFVVVVVPAAGTPSPRPSPSFGASVGFTGVVVDAANKLEVVDEPPKLNDGFLSASAVVLNPVVVAEVPRPPRLNAGFVSVVSDFLMPNRPPVPKLGAVVDVLRVLAGAVVDESDPRPDEEEPKPKLKPLPY